MMPKSGNYELSYQRKQCWSNARARRRLKQAARDKKNARDKEITLELGRARLALNNLTARVRCHAP